MADVKWIKITTDIFDDEKILLIESLPDSYAIITVWFKLLCLAGKQNNSGVFMMGQIAYTDNMLATIFRMKESTVTMALRTFEQFGMVAIVDGVITIPNWDKHQTLDSYEKKKERDRLYQQERRANQKALIAKSSDSKTIESSYVAISDKEEEKEIEEEIEKEVYREKTDYQKIIDLFNTICKSFPSVRSLSDTRKKAIKARLNTYTVDDFKECFENAEASSFLKGGNQRNWTANFDWLIKDSNMAKVLDGNYNDAKDVDNSSLNNADEFVTAALSRGFSDMFNEPEYVKDDPKLKAEAEKLKKQLSELY